MPSCPLERPEGFYRAGRLMLEFRESRRLTWEKFGEYFGMQQTTLARWIRGEGPGPSAYAAYQIEKLTKGKVPVRSWWQRDRSAKGKRIVERVAAERRRRVAQRAQ